MDSGTLMSNSAKGGMNHGYPEQLKSRLWAGAKDLREGDQVQSPVELASFFIVTSPNAVRMNIKSPVSQPGCKHTPWVAGGLCQPGPEQKVRLLLFWLRKGLPSHLAQRPGLSLK